MIDGDTPDGAWISTECHLRELNCDLDSDLEDSECDDDYDSPDPLCEVEAERNPLNLDLDEEYVSDPDDELDDLLEETRASYLRFRKAHPWSKQQLRKMTFEGFQELLRELTSLAIFAMQPTGREYIKDWANLPKVVTQAHLQALFAVDAPAWPEWFFFPETRPARLVSRPTIDDLLLKLTLKEVSHVLPSHVNRARELRALSNAPIYFSLSREEALVQNLMITVQTRDFETFCCASSLKMVVVSQLILSDPMLPP